MTAALILIAYSLALTTLAPRILRDPARLARAPRLGVAVWYSVVASAALGLAAAAALLVATPEHSWEKLCHLVRLCVEALQGAHDWFGMIAALAAVAGATVAAVRLTIAAYRTVAASARGRLRQARLVGRAGRRLPGTDATIVDDQVAAAYLVPGRHATIVVTSAAVDALSGPELAAVIAHERGHHSGRHHLLVDGMRVLTRAFPRSRMLARAHGQVALLVEICADDAAAVRHDRLDLARALVTMAEAASASPAGALAATGGDAATRVRRLLTPPRPLRRGTALVAAALLGVLVVAPVVMAVVATVWPALMDCPGLG
ncbi:M56 family metallopeptidase [Phytomonospora endophytica]|uniref:Zn-dependent protease with chaperone function n=1 Tax=Phytomonospora endophytica TaxID=714109 RepID=A0A841FJ51_9ACTN|nr:M56 family metallopeptidase [Phytomonospora endophytica]MBB6033177.1 Zn-dependent protease with chaperone function [Phytomonospora endophytica]GIG65404.1 hypothetical protein Pen01_16990 [Phytomonospora endophytica]